jgi:hypothetical protein
VNPVGHRTILQGLNQLLSTQVFTGALQSFDQYLAAL